ncbi:hypothetical protein NAEGRDRAFT_79015 [Naegleria gruberi]|uniref:Uncharacterized protein n=1 Tax=Naegleria gruberi TaxID=5762 RepID=D2V8M5_NAEGR|nr:uncharacterized protein NAEGRDRAFT_79015 [Naegleria gruberi]EFC46830.1 hypothetical protein NAEGRDRAFT_79015 [Naegleria gruberi]|eukprot:XP_002679574.1 hypothetical protein NAEGRDRAFT_79015 [Naegleria gruberi strain NEG-M]
MSNTEYLIHSDQLGDEPTVRPSSASVFQPQPVYYSNNAGNHSSFNSLPPPNHYPNPQQTNSTPFNPSVTNFKNWKLACGITSIIITVMGGLLSVHHFIAMIVWYAKQVPLFGTSNLFLIPMDICILLIGVCGIIGVFKQNETAAKFHAFGVTFGSIFVFFTFFIFSLPSFFAGSASSQLYYDGIISLLFYMIDIPVGIIGSIVGHMYLKVLQLVQVKKQQLDAVQYPSASNVGISGTTSAHVTPNGF